MIWGPIRSSTLLRILRIGRKFEFQLRVTIHPFVSSHRLSTPSALYPFDQIPRTAFATHSTPGAFIFSGVRPARWGWRSVGLIWLVGGDKPWNLMSWGGTVGWIPLVEGGYMSKIAGGCQYIISIFISVIELSSNWIVFVSGQQPPAQRKRKSLGDENGQNWKKQCSEERMVWTGYEIKT